MSGSTSVKSFGDVDGKPQTFIGVRLTGDYFREGANEYSLLINHVLSRFTRIADGGLSLSAYFDRPVPSSTVITLVYGKAVVDLLCPA